MAQQHKTGGHSKAAVSPALVDSVIAAESSGNPYAVSPTGAVGLMQLEPETARQYGVSNAFDPIQNIRGGTAYLTDLSKQFGGNLDAVLTAYDWGPGNVEKYGVEAAPPSTKAYVQKVKNLMGNGAPVAPQAQPPIQAAPNPGLAAYEAAAAQQDKDMAAQNAHMAPAYSAVAHSLAAPLPSEPKLPDLPSFHAQPLVREQDRQWLQGPVQAFATLWGGLSGNMIGAMSAYGDAMKGYLEGRNISANYRYAQFKAQLADALAKSKQVVDQRNMILRDRQMDISQKIAALKVLEMQSNDQKTLDMLQTNQAGSLMKYYADQQAAQEKLAMAFQTLNLRDQQLGIQQQEANARMLAAQANAAQQPTPEELESQAQMLAHYQLPGSSSWNAGNPKFAPVMARVLKINPKYRGYYYDVIKGTLQDYAHGLAAKRLNSINTTMQHLQVLTPIINALQTGNWPMFNKLWIKYSNTIGAPANASFGMAKDIIGKEIVKSIIATGGNTAERQDIARSFSPYRGKEALGAIIKTAQGLLAGQLLGLQKQYLAGTNGSGIDTPQYFQQTYLGAPARELINSHPVAPQSTDQYIVHHPAIAAGGAVETALSPIGEAIKRVLRLGTGAAGALSGMGGGEIPPIEP